MTVTEKAIVGMRENSFRKKGNAYWTKNCTFISFAFSPEQLLKKGITNVEIVFLTIAASLNVVPSITDLPPELVHPIGPVTTSLLTPEASLMYPLA